MARPTMWILLLMAIVSTLWSTQIHAASIDVPQLREACNLTSLPNGYFEPLFESQLESSGLVDAGKFVKVQCLPGFRLDGADKLQCGTDGNFQQQAHCQDIDECNIVSNKAAEVNGFPDVDYSIYSEEPDNIPDPLEQPGNGRGYPLEYPCLAPFQCVNTEGSFTCECNEANSCNQDHREFVNCNEVAIPEFGKIVEQSEVHVKFMCGAGRRLVGSSQRICVDGEWDGEQPTCEALICTPPTDVIADGWSDVNENITYVYGDEIRYGCNDNYRLAGGSGSKVCTAPSYGSDDTGQWSGKTPRCEVIQCPYPGTIAHGQTLVDSRYVGAEVHFRCHEGYELRGSRVRVCRTNGRWSGSITTCNDPDSFCPTPEVPTFGRIEGSTNYNLGDIITYHCNFGFDLIGLYQRNCTSVGQWSGRPPVCLGKGEYDDVTLYGEQLRQTAAQYNKENQEFMAKKSGDRGRTFANSQLAPTGPGTDFIFLFDVSKSVRTGTEPLYLEAVDFAKEYVSTVGVSKYASGGVRYSIVPYASETTTVLHLKDANTVEYVIDALDRVDASVADLGDGTATSSALRMVHQNVIPISVMGQFPRNPNTKKVIFLLTDGKSNMNGSPEAEASILKDDFDVTINCIGIGDGVDRAELNRIASEPDDDNKHVYLMEKHTLSQLVAELTKTEADYSICGESKGPKNIESTTAEDIQVWPWQAGIYTYNEGSEALPSFFCGGSLIAPNWILSAAHCFDPRLNMDHQNRDSKEHLKVVMGITRRVKDGNRDENVQKQQKGVKSLKIHKLYNSTTLPTFDFDIALLELEEPFNLGPYVRTVCLPPKSDWGRFLEPDSEENTASTFVTGWGKLNYKDKQKYSDDLKQLALPIRSRADCKVKDPEANGNLTNGMFCAGYLDGSRDACNGDSGGPLVRKLESVGKSGNVTMDWLEHWYQVGIVSWGVKCAQEGQYGYYTHVPRFRGWIDRHVQKNNQTL